MISGEPWGYRNRAQLHVEEQSPRVPRGAFAQLCPDRHCPISSPEINEAIRTLVACSATAAGRASCGSLEIFTDEQQVQLNVLETERTGGAALFRLVRGDDPGVVTGAVDYEGRFRVSSNSFFQVNRFLHGKLVAAALDGSGRATRRSISMRGWGCSRSRWRADSAG